MAERIGRHALLVFVPLLLAACVTIKRDTEVSCEVVPVDEDWDPVVAPFYFPERVAEFQAALADASESIEIVDNALVWRAAFPDRDPDADARIREFQSPEVSQRIADIGLDDLVVLTMSDRTARDQTVLMTVYNTQRQATTRSAVLISFTQSGCRLDRYQARATGRDHIAWFYVALVLDADTEADALKAVVDRMKQFIESSTSRRPVKVAIVAAKWSG